MSFRLKGSETEKSPIIDLSTAVEVTLMHFSQSQLCIIYYEL